MFLYLSAVLFAILALQLSITVKKAPKEGHNAFLISRIQSSELPTLAEELQKSLVMKDTKTLQSLLDEAGMERQVGDDLHSLQKSEVSLAQDFERRYNLILYYLPDDLKEFFGKCRILWDVDNLKLLLSYVIDGESQRDIVDMTGPFGYLDPEAIRYLTGATDPEELIAHASRLLPYEYSSRLTIEKWSSPIYLEFALDFAAFGFLQKANEEIGSEQVKFAWKMLQSLYEIQNILAIRRLKLAQTPSEKIEPLLFPVWVRLEKSEYKNLLETEDHPSFMRALENTYYGKYTLQDSDYTETMEDCLLRTVRAGVLETEPEIEKITRFVIELELHYEAIRKAAFLASVKVIDEE